MGGGWDIFRMNVDGTGEDAISRLRSPATRSAPDWSPDGPQIAFHVFFFPFPTGIDI